MAEWITYDQQGNITERQTYTPDPEQANRDTIEQAARQALIDNRAFVASTPTAAQTTAHVKALSRQVNGVIRLLLNQLDGTN